VSITLRFKSGNIFNATGRILRKSGNVKDGFSYGVQFVEISEDDSNIMKKELLKYEADYLKSLNVLREYKKFECALTHARITILSNDIDESYEIREVNADIVRAMAEVRENYPDVYVILLSPIETIEGEAHEIDLAAYLEPDELDEISALSNIIILYKPLVFNEFQQEITKYL